MNKKCGKNDFPKMVTVKKVFWENPSTFTLLLDVKLDVKPGQYVMVWLPRVDEKPMSVTYSGKELGFTALVHGESTRRMSELKKGGLLGVRGPYGNAFEFGKAKRALLVGGGAGVPPLAWLAEEMARKGVKATFIMGARSKDHLMFERRIGRVAKLLVCTDDGSKGAKARTPELVEKLLGREKFDCVFTCGPEIMMKKVFDECEKRKVECQASLERYFKCAFGVCGQCCLDDKLVCVDGTVFGSAFLRTSKEFGKHTYARTGARITTEEWLKHGM